MSSTKTATLTLRISPEIKQKLKSAAEREHRSIANMVEVLIRDYCEQNKISVTDKNDDDNKY
ncbi:TPA: hypothetical protein F8S49_11360 [Legionella pneumophila]|nr:hypothetical protein [Legionella pneumophila]HAU1496586.1 hypothetical protein [Legionella pneumophila]